MSGLLTDGRSQQGQVRMGGWEGDEGVRKKGGDGQTEGTGLVGGQKATASLPQMVERVGVNVSFPQYFMTLCQRAGPLIAQALKCVTS